MLITRTCPFSGIKNTRDIPITTEQYDRWQSGVLIQYAMPNISPSDREFIATGLTDDEWPWPREDDQDDV